MRPLGPEDLPRLQRLLEGAPTYHERVEGAPASPDAARSLLAELPPGRGPEHKLVLGLEEQGDLVACVDLARGFPTPEFAFVGLLLVREDLHGRGLGTRALHEAEETVRRLWPEARRLRLAVASTNDVVGFWELLGFALTGERRPMPRFEALLMEKPLA